MVIKATIIVALINHIVTLSMMLQSITTNITGKPAKPIAIAIAASMEPTTGPIVNANAKKYRKPIKGLAIANNLTGSLCSTVVQDQKLPKSILIPPIKK